MAAQILPFGPTATPAATPIAFYARVGAAHRKHSELRAAGHFPAQRIVIEASRFRTQAELVSEIRDAGCDLVLDTELAELAAKAKFSGHARSAPWGGSLLGPDRFQGGALTELMNAVARFAVASGFTTVLAPTHFLGDPDYSGWLSRDVRACAELRKALDRAGGSDIRIDYPLILPNTMLNDASRRAAIVDAITDQPFDNLCVRSSGFGSDAGPLAIKRYITSLKSLHALGKPIIADDLGGLVSWAAIAFGAISGSAHGLGEAERFDARGWHKYPTPPPENAHFGRPIRASIPGLHRSVTMPELDLLISARGGRRLCVCGDRSCCPNGLPDMAANPKGHLAREKFRTLSAIEAVPDLRREDHFLAGLMKDASRKARDIQALRPSQSDAIRLGVDAGDLMRRLAAHSQHIDKVYAALDHLHETRGESTSRAVPVNHKPTGSIRSQQIPS